MTTTDTTTAAADNVTDLAAVRQSRSASSKAKAPKKRQFDAEKVARLKAEIAAGSYKIDPSSIANKFIEHERN